MTTTTRRARAADPSTSHAAAAGQSDTALTATQQRVLNCFRLYGDMTDTTLARNLNDLERANGFTKLTSPSGARSRRKDLSRANEERLRELRRDWYRDHEVVVSGESIGHAGLAVNFDALEQAVPVVQREAAAEWARRTLRLEGFRAPLWPTGAVEKLPTGYNAIVWGIAR